MNKISRDIKVQKLFQITQSGTLSSDGTIPFTIMELTGGVVYVSTVGKVPQLSGSKNILKYAQTRNTQNYEKAPQEMGSGEDNDHTILRAQHR